MFAVPFVARVVYHSGVLLRSRFFVCLTLVPEVVYHSGVLLRSGLCVRRSICGQGGVTAELISALPFVFAVPFEPVVYQSGVLLRFDYFASHHGMFLETGCIRAELLSA